MMRLTLNNCLAQFLSGILVMGILSITPLPSSLIAEEKVKETEKEVDDAEKKETDPYAVPQDATVQELFAWISKAKRTPPPRDAIAETARKLFPAIIEACNKIIEQSDSEADFKRATQEKFAAYGILVRFSPSARRDLNDFAKKCAEDKRPEIAQLGVSQMLSMKTLGTNTSAEEAQLLADETLSFLKRFGANRATYGAVAGIARNMGNTSHTEIAAVLHESIAKLLEEAEDESVRERAPKMIAAARRIRLPGNEMVLAGTTADGSAFDWSAYRGKVVLVDFWASWCGPCIAEIPNMKKNLERYGDKGFAIVGINMDSTRDRFEKCVEEKEITWVNIVSEEEGKTGWNAPIADYYGISAIPTAILVDQQGKVVSLRARGEELDRLLEKLLVAE